MSRVFNKLFLLCIAVSLALLPNRAAAQRTFGVAWNVPGNTDEAVRQLDRFRQLNIEYLEIDRTVSDNLWDEIQSRNFNIYIQIPVRYPVVETFSNPDSSLVSTYRRFISTYAGRNIDGLGVFEYGQTNSRSFPDVAAQMLNPIKKALPIPLYIKDWNYQAQPADTLFDFKIVRVFADRNFQALSDSIFTEIHAFLYQPAPALTSSVQSLKSFIEKTSVNDDAILFFSSSWLLEFLDTHPEVEPILRQYTTQQDAVFPTAPEQIPVESRHSGAVLILLVLWGSFALNYSYEPMYRRSLFRYFLSHKFFVEDVIQRHIRSVLPSLVILVQHAVMGGIFLYCFATFYLTQFGTEVFFQHFQEFQIFGTGLSAFFLMGTVATLFFELFCLLWLYLANYKHNYPSQTIILYSWSLQINLLVSTLMVTLLMANGGSFIMIILFLLFLAILIDAFLIASFDAGQFLHSYKVWYWIGTLGIYFFGVGGILLWLFNNSYILNVLRLAMSIY